jgi:hypothetical protein
MPRTALVLASFFAAALGAPGCGSPTPGAMGTVDVGDVTVEYGDLGGAHIFGSSPCPQPVGTMLITNGNDVTVTITVTTPSSQLTLTNGGPVTLGPGESVEVLIDFNCSATTDITTELTITSTPEDGGPSTGTIPFSLDIQGAP